jgi:GAF domain-containing protein
VGEMEHGVPMADVSVAVDGGTGFDVEPLVEQFVELTRTLLDSGSVAAVLDRVVDVARCIVPGADVVSVTLRDPAGEFHTPAETHRVASELDQLQYRFGEGACVEAGSPTGPALAVSDDLAVDARWPRFGPSAAALGYRSLLAAALLPDAVSPQLSGALNVYSQQPRGLDAHSRNVVMLLASHASVVLARTQAVTRGQLEVEQLREALNSRDVIGQAKGILMVRRGISADEAFAVLRQTSQEMNIKLRDIAETVVRQPMRSTSR